MRAWLLTNTTYGNWLPGDPRGSVTSVRDRRPGDLETPFRIEHDMPGEPYEEELRGLRRSAAEKLKGAPIRLDLPKAEIMLGQYQETAAYRGWTLRAVAIMANPARGSTRKLKDEARLAEAIVYVPYKQPFPLLVWSSDLGRLI